MTEPLRHAPDAAVLERFARQAIAAMPELFRQHLDGIAIQIEELAEQEVLDELGIEDPWELTGLYQGHALTEQSIWSSGDLPPIIRLYRRPLLEEWVDSGVALDTLIAHVIVHEVGHHFGFSDEDMHAIEEGLGS
ncbi:MULTISPECIES: metallopeptidase family protein [unclassified Sphingobium]|uniref:metallopeptidase family protein n=1 Tax=unclassified Sphingobium TaxID=2611147 RepID=UPI0029CAB685|nr:MULTISPECIES: metallopeptidase family protein [unclassified Sphingobium]MCW2412911.1 putative Zn-dependent protease with MMP-like domain [Sphingobium sp. B8D3D]MCW2414791.1 putative Zn-dependent protease with MMP-like domain [Sphingobium sp. B8D3A]